MFNQLLMAFAICAAAAGFEAWCAGKDPMAELRKLRQPAWAPPVWVWIVIGIAWYAACFTALARLLPYAATRPVPVVLLIVLMFANGAVNLLQFRLRRLDLALLSFPPYWVILGAFLFTVWPLDRTTAVLFSIYAGYQGYAVAWGYALWRLNAGTEADLQR